MNSPLVDSWTSAVDRAVGDETRISLLYSGGLDSSVIAHTLRSKRPTLVTVGANGAADVTAATEGARLLDLPMVVRTLTEADVRAALRRWGTQLEGTNEMERSISIGIALATETAPDRRVLCGQGADELFLGYSHFVGLSTADVDARAQVDWQRLVDRDWPRARSLASSLDKELASPYLDPSFADVVRAVSIEERLGGGVRKVMLRELARNLGVPRSLVDRPKKAFQYGSGLARMVRQLRDDQAHRDRTAPMRA